MKIKRVFPPLLVVIGVGLLTAIAASTAIRTERPELPENIIEDVTATAARIDDPMLRRWDELGIAPAPSADELEVLRRLSLALHGTIPSLEEIRLFEADAGPHRLTRWTAAMLNDPRFADYFAERLARAYVGVEEGEFVIFRRDRFTDWLRIQLGDRRPYDEIVREMISGRGVWTGKGEVNFVTAGFANEEFDANKLTARTVRAFLGQRMDCAQCHDHPFDDWTQDQFQGLAAYYGQVELSLAGIRDKSGEAFGLPDKAAEYLKTGTIATELRKRFRENGDGLRKHARLEMVAADRLWVVRDSQKIEENLEPRFVIRRTPTGFAVSSYEGEYFIEDRDSLEQQVVDPSVPFHPEWLGTEGTRRDRLAAWVTHPDNRRFDRALVNRVWGLLFGKPYLSDRPVDDLPDPDREEDAEETRVLDLLGCDFREQGCDLRRLVQVIAATRAFRMDSRAATSDPQQLEQAERAWAVFPITRRRPEQVIGAMLQANTVRTVDQNSHLFVRFQKFIRERDFVNEYGDLGENELDDRAGTISQALLRMNGEFAHEMAEEEPFTAPGRIASYSSTPEKLLENCFLACLTRRPTPEEAAYFLPQLEDDNDEPDGVVQDVFWTLFNSPEF